MPVPCPHWVDENPKQAEEVATAAILRYDEISRIGRKEDAKPKSTDWPAMLASGRNLYGNPEQCIQVIRNAMKHYSFNIMTNTFNFGGIPHDMITKSMRLFAKEVMPAFKQRSSTARDEESFGNGASGETLRFTFSRTGGK